MFAGSGSGSEHEGRGKVFFFFPENEETPGDDVIEGGQRRQARAGPRQVDWPGNNVVETLDRMSFPPQDWAQSTMRPSWLRQEGGMDPESAVAKRSPLIGPRSS